MAENNSTPSTPVAESPEAGTNLNTAKPEDAPKQGRPASPWNKTQLAELGKAERLCLAAMQDSFAAVFAKSLFPAERLTAFRDKITAARNQTATAGQAGTASEELTLDQAEAEKLLVADIRKVQAAAKQLHARKNPVALKDYLVGTDVTQSNAALQQHAQTLIKKLESERPPSIDTQFIENMTTHRTAVVGAGVTQGSSDSKAEAERFARDQQIEAIKDERIEIQYVIDGEFGPGNPANAAVRRQFDLPPNRPFNAVKRKSS